jgi:hypothetical protein
MQYERHGEMHVMKRGSVVVENCRHAVEHAMKRAVVVEDYRHALGEARERHAMHKRGL